MNFGEKQTEYSAKHGGEIPVWQSPKYMESKKKAEEIIESGKYGVATSDFWILMNATKSGKMAYTGLIISHNGCLKINDRLESKFSPSCVSVDKDGYRGSLVYSYCNDEQGIYEVGEVSTSNCKNEYPYAMAYKRLFDRVVLKLSKLAYAGIYSDSEADEFAQRLDDTPKQEEKPKEQPPTIPKCERCGRHIISMRCGNKVYSINEIIENSVKSYGAELCWDCMKELKEAKAGDDA